MIRKSTIALVLLATSLLFVASSSAQGGPAPTRAAPTAISGMYTFLQDGEFVQISVDPDGHLSGFVSRYNDNEKHAGFLDHFFDKATLHDHDITFTTKTVHGVWYEFKGTYGKGEGKTRAQEGYYIIRGTLTENASDANKKVSARTREVTFKSFPEDAQDEKASR